MYEFYWNVWNRGECDTLDDRSFYDHAVPESCRAYDTDLVTCMTYLCNGDYMDCSCRGYPCRATEVDECVVPTEVNGVAIGTTPADLQWWTTTNCIRNTVITAHNGCTMKCEGYNSGGTINVEFKCSN